MTWQYGFRGYGVPPAPNHETLGVERQGPAPGRDFRVEESAQMRSCANFRAILLR